MHRLVHLAARMLSQQRGMSAEAIKSATLQIEATFPTSDFENRTMWREYLPHAIRILEDDRKVDLEEKYQLCIEVGNCLRSDGRVTEAVRWLQKGCTWFEMSLADKEPSRLASQHELAGAYEANRQIDKAVKLLEHVVTTREKRLKDDHPDRLASQHELAGAYQV